MSDEYPGHVEPGGPAIRREVEVDGTTVEVRKFSVGPMDNNAYLLTDTGSRTALLVDAANDPERILAELGGTALAGIVTTHGHRDHWQALDAVADATGAVTILHPGDAGMVPRSPDRPADDGLRVPFGEASVELLHTPGHTLGSVCVLLGGRHLFSGDTLFPGGPGKTTSPEQFAQIMESVERRLFDVLPDETWVYPGHGDDTTIGAERPKLPEWRARGW